MARSDRLLDLLQILRRHRRPVSGRALAEEAGVSLRTVRRDVASLQAMGADIAGEPGVGYVLRPGFLLPPLMFSEEEIHALALGVQWVGGQTDPGMARAARSALARIGAALPESLRDQLEDNGFYVGAPDPKATTVDTAVFREAIRRQMKVEIDYRDHHERSSGRTVWPISLGFIDNRRYVAAWCELRRDFRVFRLDRIARAELDTERYPGRRRDLVRRWRSEADRTGNPGELSSDRGSKP